jgi:hypothetical protein
MNPEPGTLNLDKLPLRLPYVREPDLPAPPDAYGPIVFVRHAIAARRPPNLLDLFEGGIHVFAAPANDDERATLRAGPQYQ